MTDVFGSGSGRILSWDTITAGSTLGLTLDGTEHDVEISALMPTGSFSINGSTQATISTTIPPPGKIWLILAASVNFHSGANYVVSALNAWLYVKQYSSNNVGKGDGLWLATSSPAAASVNNNNATFVYGVKSDSTYAASTAPAGDGNGAGNRYGTAPCYMAYGLNIHLQYIAYTGDSCDCRILVWERDA